jgi:flagellar FliJ protein
MPPFHFSLEQVLRYRKQLEERAMLALVRTTAARDERLREKEACARAMKERQARLARIADLGTGERWLIAGYLAGLTHDYEQATIDLVALEEDVDRARTHLTEKAQERKLLEKLKEKQAARHAKTEEHHEQQTLDDIATIRFTPPAF